ncbi:Dynactin subunit p22 [Cryptosporidium felis]|nr:Dynactin subunit p22 [Cryptosporidium felis]
MTQAFDVEEFLDNIERRIKKCEEVLICDQDINSNDGSSGKHPKLAMESSGLSVSSPSAQNRATMGQNSLLVSLESDIQELDKVKNDSSVSINNKLDLIENIVKKIYSLGPLENWVQNYETIRAYLEMDSADFESSVLTLDLRKAYIIEHYDELISMKSQLSELEDLLPYLNRELDIESIQETRRKLKELELKSKKTSHETQILWENLQKLVISYSNFVFKYNLAKLNK